MTIQQEIEKAIAIEKCKNDPLNRERWIELGKAMGWDKDTGRITMYRYDGISKNPEEIKYTDMKIHILHWHRLIDSLAEGKSIEDYFAGLK